MVAKRVVLPETVLHPECAVKKRVVLLGRPRLGPDAGQAPKRAQGRGGHVVAVIPDQGPRERRQVGEDGRANHQRRGPDAAGDG